MSEARGRPAQESAETTREDTTGRNIALTTGATVAAMGAGAAIISKEEKKERERIDKEAKRRNEEVKRKYRGGGGGGLYVTPNTATKRDVTKRFKKN